MAARYSLPWWQSDDESPYGLNGFHIMYLSQVFTYYSASMDAGMSQGTGWGCPGAEGIAQGGMARGHLWGKRPIMGGPARACDGHERACREPDKRRTTLPGLSQIRGAPPSLD